MGKKKRVAKPDKKPNVIPLPMDATFFFERAIRSLDRFHYEKAVKYFRRAVDYEPDNPVNHCNLAGVLSEMGKYGESNQILQQILDQVDPEMTECHFYMANNYANMDDFESAERAIVQYLENDPSGQFLEEAEEMMELISSELNRPAPVTSIKSREGMFEHDKARNLLEEGRFAEAVRLLLRLVKKYPEFQAARNNLALAYYYMGQFDKAMETILQVLEMEPGNLHGLCNLAIFYQHLGEMEQLSGLAAVLRKMYPYHQEHSFKLATTMGILGEHEAAYRLFRQLLKKSGEAATEPSMYHYTAVAAYHIGRYHEAERLWFQAERLDPGSEIPKYYLQLMWQGDSGQAKPTFGYHYHLPFEEQFRIVEQAEGGIPEHLRRDPLVRSSFFWALRHGDAETKLQVIQALGAIADSEVEDALRAFLLEPEEDEYLKKLALFVIRSMGASEPIEVHLGGEIRQIAPAPYSPQLPVWQPAWQQILSSAIEQMAKRYDLVQLHDLETLWIEYLSRTYPLTPRIGKTGGWVAALEYLTAKMHRRAISYEEVSNRYQVSVSTIIRNVKMIDEACGLKEKMNAIFSSGGKPLS